MGPKAHEDGADRGYTFPMSMMALALLAAGSAFAAPAWHAELGLFEREGQAVYRRHQPRTGVASVHVLTAPEKALLDEALAKISDASWKAESASLVLASLAEHGIPPQSTRYFKQGEKDWVLTVAGLEAVPGAILKDPFAARLFSWPLAPVLARAKLVMAEVQDELSLRDIGLSQGKEPSAYVRASVLCDASAEPDSASRLHAAAPAPGVSEKKGDDAANLIRKLPVAREILRYVAGVSVKDSAPSRAEETAWQTLDLRVNVRVPVLDPKRDIFIGVAGQW